MTHDEAIMGLLRTERRPMTNREIADALGVPRPYITRALGVLLRYKMVRNGPPVRMKGQRPIPTWEVTE